MIKNALTTNGHQFYKWFGLSFDSCEFVFIRGLKFLSFSVASR
jgi:hypothetical protein